MRTVELALATAEELDVAPVIQVSPAEAHLMLDEALEARGMTWSGPSLVLAGEVRSVAVGEATVAVGLGELTPEWVEAWSSVSGIGGAAETAEAVLSQLGGRARFAIARDATSGEAVGTAVGVVEDGWLGLFSLAVLPARRRDGIGAAIVDALQAWSAAVGARRIYLQVEADNDIALAFYARRGFHIAHSYHYRSE
ncbi:MAG TPA: GNAT family N-acetyltransferase [Baekduia sp.]|nr:GNAT family N-acetyltransferase [Baekduia sp.]